MKVTVYFKHCKQLLVCKGGQIGGATLMPPPSSMNAQEIQTFPHKFYCNGSSSKSAKA